MLRGVRGVMLQMRRVLRGIIIGRVLWGVMSRVSDGAAAGARRRGRGRGGGGRDARSARQQADGKGLRDERQHAGGRRGVARGEHVPELGEIPREKHAAVPRWVQDEIAVDDVLPPPRLVHGLVPPGPRRHHAPRRLPPPDSPGRPAGPCVRRHTHRHCGCEDSWYHQPLRTVTGIPPAPAVTLILLERRGPPPRITAVQRRPHQQTPAPPLVSVCVLVGVRALARLAAVATVVASVQQAAGQQARRRVARPPLCDTL